MNAVVEESANKITEFRAPGPGERLRAARVAQGLEAAKVAAQLHLSEAMVAALERDDYERLPGRVFVRGYMRNYARLVGLPVESVLKQFEDQVPDQTALRKLNPIGSSIRPEVHSNHGIMRLITWAVVLALLGLFAVWWQGYLSWRDGSEPTEEAVVPEPVLPSAIDADGRFSLPRRPEPVATDPSGVASIPEPMVARALSTTAPTGAGLRSREPSEVAGPGFADTSGSAAAAIPQTAPTVTLAQEQPSAAAGSGEAAVGPPAIVFEFNGPCWVDVRDAKRKFKLFGEMPKGTRKVLGGEPPYDVVLGNASVVKVTVNGETYDVGRHARGNVARFRLDPATD